MIPLNIGKVFEEQIGKSVPDYALLYRLHDSAQSFGGSSKLRFSSKNPFDYILWDSMRHILYALELKTVKEKSISFERQDGDEGKIHLHQINGLMEWDKYDGITCGFIIEFRELETTCFINVKDFKELIDKIPKKSFNMKDLLEYKVPHIIIPQKKARTRYTYDLDSFLSDASK